MKARVIKKRGDILYGYFLVLDGEVQEGDYVRSPMGSTRNFKKWGPWQPATVLIGTKIKSLD